MPQSWVFLIREKGYHAPQLDLTNAIILYNIDPSPTNSPKLPLIHTLPYINNKPTSLKNNNHPLPIINDNTLPLINHERLLRPQYHPPLNQSMLNTRPFLNNKHAPSIPNTHISLSQSRINPLPPTAINLLP